MHEAQISVAHCARCQLVSEDLDLITCPRCGEVLGEIVVTRRRGPWWPVALHWLVVLAAVMIVAVAL